MARSCSNVVLRSTIIRPVVDVMEVVSRTFKTAISANKALDMAARFMLSAFARIFDVVDGAFFSRGIWY